MRGQLYTHSPPPCLLDTDLVQDFGDTHHQPFLAVKALTFTGQRGLDIGELIKNIDFWGWGGGEGDEIKAVCFSPYGQTACPSLHREAVHEGCSMSGDIPPLRGQPPLTQGLPGLPRRGTEAPCAA